GVGDAAEARGRRPGRRRVGGGAPWGARLPPEWLSWRMIGTWWGRPPLCRPLDRMPRTCSRMKPSASPKPASGPVFGLTCPILMTRLCELAGITRSTAGAAMAPRPARTSVRREMPEFKSCDAAFAICASTPDQAGHCECLAIRRARLLEMLQHLRAQRGLRIRAPRAKALARFEAELAIRYQRFETGRGPAAVLDIGQH